MWILFITIIDGRGSERLGGLKSFLGGAFFQPYGREQNLLVWGGVGVYK